jgi:glycosyltransferase involved in cell wall biosynthesis
MQPTKKLNRKRRNKICYLANAASVHTMRWANYFAERNWDIDLISWHKKPESIEADRNINLHYIHLPPHYLARYGALIELAYTMRQIKPDLIHAHYLSHFGVLASLHARLSGFKPLVVTAWGSDVLGNSQGYRHWWLKYVLKRAELITCDAEHMIEVMVKLGADDKRIKLIYFGTDTQKFKPQPKSRKLVESLELEESPVVISTRSLDPIYDVESLIRAIPLILEEVPRAEFIIAGSGRQRDYLVRLAEELAVSDSIRFTGLIPEDKLPAYLNLADVYVSTSLSDAGLAASTAEAMACGLPAVITDFGDNRKWVTDEANGFLVPPQDPTALAAAVINLLQDKSKRQRLGKANRKMIDERNNRHKEMGKMEKLYQEQIERWRK